MLSMSSIPGYHFMSKTPLKKEFWGKRNYSLLKTVLSLLLLSATLISLMVGIVGSTF